MKLLLCIAVIAAAATLAAAEPEDDARFAFVNVDDDGIRLTANSTSIAYGVVGVLVVAVLVLLLIPLLSSLLGGGEETGLSAPSGYDTGYSSYKRSLESAMPIISHLQAAWQKYQ